ncbi:MAG: cytidine deaminase [Armatimonadota bacterium]
MQLSQKQIDILIKSAISARKNAYAPYSNYKVGCSVLVQSNKIYTGCNVENASYGLTVCAERVAILKAVSEGEKEITALAVVAEEEKIVSPCGACLQVMAEFSSKDDELIIIACNLNEKYGISLLSDYLPKQFDLQ